MTVHRWHREYFINQREIIKDWTPRDPEKRTEFLRRYRHFRDTRDPSFSSRDSERGWNNRAGVEAAQYNHQVHAYRRYHDGGLDGHIKDVGLAASAAERGSPFLNNRPDLQAVQTQVLQTYRHPFTPAHSRDRGGPWPVALAARNATARAYATVPARTAASPAAAYRSAQAPNAPGSPFPTPHWGEQAPSPFHHPSPRGSRAHLLTQGGQVGALHQGQAAVLHLHPRVQSGQPQAYVEHNPWVHAHRAAEPLSRNASKANLHAAGDDAHAQTRPARAGVVMPA
jgi:hypothetical protein